MTPPDRHHDPSRLTETVRDELLRQLRRRGGSEIEDPGDDHTRPPRDWWKPVVIVALALAAAFAGKEIQSGHWRSWIEHDSQQTPTALCADKTYSYAKHHEGACSHHGGVARWLK